MADPEKASHYLLGSDIKKNRILFLIRTCTVIIGLILSPVAAIGFGFYVSYEVDNHNDTYRLPQSQFVKDGRIKVSFDNLRNGTFVPEFKTLQWIDRKSVV